MFLASETKKPNFDDVFHTVVAPMWFFLFAEFVFEAHRDKTARFRFFDMVASLHFRSKAVPLEGLLLPITEAAFDALFREWTYPVESESFTVLKQLEDGASIFFIVDLGERENVIRGVFELNGRAELDINDIDGGYLVKVYLRLKTALPELLEVDLREALDDVFFSETEFYSDLESYHIRQIVQTMTGEPTNPWSKNVGSRSLMQSTRSTSERRDKDRPRGTGFINVGNDALRRPGTSDRRGPNRSPSPIPQRLIASGKTTPSPMIHVGVQTDKMLLDALLTSLPQSSQMVELEREISQKTAEMNALQDEVERIRLVLFERFHFDVFAEEEREENPNPQQTPVPNVVREPETRNRIPPVRVSRDETVPYSPHSTFPPPSPIRDSRTTSSNPLFPESTPIPQNLDPNTSEPLNYLNPLPESVVSPRHNLPAVSIPLPISQQISTAPSPPSVLPVGKTNPTNSHPVRYVPVPAANFVADPLSMAGMAPCWNPPQPFVPQYLAQNYPPPPLQLPSTSGIVHAERPVQRPVQPRKPILSTYQEMCIIGGQINQRFISTLDIFDAQTSMWIPLTELPDDHLFVLGGAAAIERCIFTMGGFRGRQALQEVQRYDAERRSWDKVCQMRSGRNGVVVTELDKKIYLVAESLQVSSLVDVYDPILDMWTPTAPLVYPRYRHAAVSLSNQNVMFVFGGQSNENTLCHAVERFDPREGAWRIVCNMPRPRHGLLGAGHNDRFYALGGTFASSSKAMCMVDIFETRLQQWRVGPEMNHAHNTGAAICVENDLYVIGGMDEQRQPFGMERLSWDSDAWETDITDGIVDTRSFHSLVTLPKTAG